MSNFQVADCIALMAMQKHEVVPVDTHVFEVSNALFSLHPPTYVTNAIQVTRKIYLPNLSGKSLNANLHKEIRKTMIFWTSCISTGSSFLTLYPLSICL